MHGVPRIIENSWIHKNPSNLNNPTNDTSIEANSCSDFNDDLSRYEAAVSEYLSMTRVNLNVRQVWDENNRFGPNGKSRAQPYDHDNPIINRT